MATDHEQQKKLLQRAQALCSRQEKCLSDVRIKLKQWGATPDMSNQILALLLADKFIDEERYARMYANEKARINKWGKIRIENSLRAKGVSGENIEAAIESVEELASSENLMGLLKRKIETTKAKSPQDLKVKLIRFASYRGFSYCEIQKALEKLKVNDQDG